MVYRGFKINKLAQTKLAATSARVRVAAITYCLQGPTDKHKMINKYEQPHQRDINKKCDKKCWLPREIHREHHRAKLGPNKI